MTERGGRERWRVGGGEITGGRGGDETERWRREGDGEKGEGRESERENWREHNRMRPTSVFVPLFTKRRPKSCRSNNRI